MSYTLLLLALMAIFAVVSLLLVVVYFAIEFLSIPPIVLISAVLIFTIIYVILFIIVNIKSKEK